MYKTKMVVWILVFVLWIASVIVPGALFKSTTVTVSSDETQILRNLNRKKIAGNKLFASNNNSDITITSVAIDGIQEIEKFYSPIVGFLSSTYCNGFHDISNSFTVVYVADFSKIFDGFLQDKKWDEMFPGSKKEVINVSVYENSEKEIKDLMYISFCSIYDSETAKQKTIQCWDKAYKIMSMDNIAEEAKANNVFMVGPEYIYGISEIRNTMYKVNPSETVAKNFFVYIVSDLYEKDYILEMLREEKFMKKSGLRSYSYRGIYNKGVLANYDSAMKITEVDVEWDGITIENSEEMREIIENAKQHAEAAPPEVQGEPVVSQNISEDIEESHSETEGEWEINKKESDTITDGNKEINPNAYGANEQKNFFHIKLFLKTLSPIIFFLITVIFTTCFVLKKVRDIVGGNR